MLLERQATRDAKGRWRRVVARCREMTLLRKGPTRRGRTIENESWKEISCYSKRGVHTARPAGPGLRLRLAGGAAVSDDLKEPRGGVLCKRTHRRDDRAARPDPSGHAGDPQVSEDRRALAVSRRRTGNPGPHFTSQVSPARRSLDRSPGPRLAMTSLICEFMTSS